MQYQIVSGNRDVIGHILKRTPDFKGRGRLVSLWMRRQSADRRRIRLLPGGGKALCDLTIPYEAMVWLEKEEQADLQTLRSLLKPGQRFVDCGANIGLWSLVAASAVGTAGSVIAFEPNPTTYNKLLSNIALSGFTNIAPQPCALSHAAGVVPFTCAAQHNISQITDAPSADSVDVPAMTLDAALAQMESQAASTNTVAGCKIDVEGHELPLLRGAEQLLRRDKPWLCVEFNTLLSASNRLGDWDAHCFLRGLGYAAYRFENAFAPTDANKLREDWQTDGYCNLYYK